MKPIHIVSGTCAFFLIISVLMAGCIFLPAGTTPSQPVTTGETPAPGATIEVSQTPEKEVSSTCTAIGGIVCLADETCTGTLIKTTDSSRCCAGTCTIPPSETLTVQPTQTKPEVTLTETATVLPTQTVTGMTPAITMLPQTPGVTPTATATTVQTMQTPEAETTKTCVEIGGDLCLPDETCSGALVQTSDYNASARCCAGVCIAPPPPVITPPPATPTPVVIPSVAKTCDEIGGNICQGGQTCSGGLIKTTDSDRCCAGTCT